MQTKQTVKNKVNIRFSGKDIYLEKKGIILDKTCKNCKKLILHEREFCECGFFLKSEKNSVFWSSVIFPVLLIGIVCLAGTINFEGIKNLAIEKIKIQITS
ncbi:MAG: hypothetical protein PHC34_07430, partial [Candidatus Gastranaerophilales bacterium]|nr:hypothetical protein [Candidatus Gastranaerophilales bacterium]